MTAGGWTAEPVAGTIPDSVEVGLKAAVQASGFVGGDLTPIAYFANQVVAGTNYAVLCEEKLTTKEPAEKLVVATFTIDEKSKAGNLDVEDFDLAEYAEEGSNLMFPMGMAGGWQIPEKYSKLDAAPEEIATAVGAITDPELEGATYTPMAYLGSQVVSGMNYAFLCHVDLVTEEPVEEIAVVTVYVDLESKAEISTVCTIMSPVAPEEEGEGEGEEAETGGWTIKAEEVKLPKQVQAAFEEAMAGFVGSDIEPVAYFAKQVVNGVNYGILCTIEMVVKDQEETQKALCLVEISTDVEGKDVKIASHSFDLTEYVDEEENLIYPTAAAGGWLIPEDHTTLKDVIPPEEVELEGIKAVIDAVENSGIKGIDIEVMNYLGCQVVAGTNFAFLCHLKTVTETPVNKIAVVVANMDPEQKISIENICVVLDETPPEPEHKYTFSDVPEGEWYTDAIYDLADAGIMTGYEGNKVFGTMDLLSRAQFVTILYRIEGEPEVTTSGSFTDVPADSWYSDAVEWAKAKGVITGYEGTKLFGPADSITREQMATMLWRLNKSPVVDYALNFTDVKSVSSWALEAVRWAASENILQGKDNKTRIDPQGLTKRCECAAMIDRMLIIAI
jgi:hypothetical protein